MLASSSILRALFFVGGLALLGTVPAVGQSLREQTRPRTLTTAPEEPSELLQPVGSSEAKSAAKKAYRAGVEYGNAGLFSQAAELFRRATKLRPDYSDAYRSLGRAYMDLNDWDNAVKSLERALELNTKDKEARKLLDETRLHVESNRGDTSQFVGPKTRPLRPVATPVAAAESSLTKVYRVGVGDVLEIHIGSPSATDQFYTINSGGLLEHPSLTQPLRVVGLTTDEITARFEDALKPNSTTANTRVTVGIQEYISHVIIVSGFVKEPGTKSLRREAIPLSVVVADAQPLPEAERALVVRNETKETFTVDLSQAAETALLIHPGDVITLQANPKQFFYVSGEVKSPGEKVFRRGLTLTQAIITAGGLQGEPKEVRLARDDGKGFLNVTRYRLKEIEEGKTQDPLIQPGDRITIIF